MLKVNINNIKTAFASLIVHTSILLRTVGMGGELLPSCVEDSWHEKRNTYIYLSACEHQYVRVREISTFYPPYTSMNFMKTTEEQETHGFLCHFIATDFRFTRFTLMSNYRLIDDIHSGFN